MAFDIKTLLARPITSSERRRAYALEQELIDLRLADFGASMQRHLIAPGGLEDVLETLMLNNADPAAIVRGIRFYILTGHRPTVRYRRS